MLNKLIVFIICTVFPAPIHASYLITYGRDSLVVFPHDQHKKSLKGCTDCHGSNKPGPIVGFGKKWIHETCKECHRESKVGPVECYECHTQI